MYSDPVYILLIKKSFGKKLVAFQMLINFGVGDLGSNQIINVNPTSYFPKGNDCRNLIKGKLFLSDVNYLFSVKGMAFVFGYRNLLHHFK